MNILTYWYSIKSISLKVSFRSRVIKVSKLHTYFIICLIEILKEIPTSLRGGIHVYNKLETRYTYDVYRGVSPSTVPAVA